MSEARDRDAARAALERLRRWGGEPLVREMATLFAESVAERTSELRAGAAAVDRMVMSRAAHALKTSCGQMGADAAVRLCRAIEDGAATETDAALQRLTVRLADECAEFLAWLRAELATLDPGTRA